MTFSLKFRSQIETYVSDYRNPEAGTGFIMYRVCLEEIEYGVDVLDSDMISLKIHKW